MYVIASAQLVSVRAVSVGMTMPLCEQHEEPVPIQHSCTLYTVLWYSHIHDNQRIMPSLAITKTILKQTEA